MKSQQETDEEENKLKLFFVMEIVFAWSIWQTWFVEFTLYISSLHSVVNFPDDWIKLKSMQNKSLLHLWQNEEQTHKWLKALILRQNPIKIALSIDLFEKRIISVLCFSFFASLFPHSFEFNSKKKTLINKTSRMNS